MQKIQLVFRIIIKIKESNFFTSNTYDCNKINLLKSEKWADLNLYH